MAYWSYDFFKYVEPELVKALEEIGEALQEAEEEGDEDDVDELTQLKNVGVFKPILLRVIMFLAWTSGIYGDKTVYATMDPTTGKFTLKD